ncbi:carboxypeptidase-like regulatory domain-containing protein [Microbacterium sp. NPDC077184]|uniref:carboxypeptidase-like regulatory domain-containing protein n=1 Tax=Microbacterium sp. NPDC077184 TaxID=3154764 RepID=UPI0034331FCC
MRLPFFPVPAQRRGRWAVIAAASAVAAILTVGTAGSVASADANPTSTASPTPVASPSMSPSTQPTAAPDPEDESPLKGNLTGTVVIAGTGTALPGAEVTIIPTEPGIDLVTVTNAQGVFRFPQLSIDDYGVRVELRGFQTSETRALVRTNTTTSIEVPLTPAIVELRLDRSTVAPSESLQLTAAGFPVGDTVRIEVRPSSIPPLSATTDDAGSLSQRLTIPAGTTPGTYEIVVTGQSGHTAVAEFTVRTPAPLPVTG